MLLPAASHHSHHLIPTKMLEYLRQLDVLPFRRKRLAVQSRLDQLLKAPPDAVMPLLCSTERRVQKDPDKAKIYKARDSKAHRWKVCDQAQNRRDELDQWVARIVSSLIVPSILLQSLPQWATLPWSNTWTFPHLGPPLRFRQYVVAINGDIQAMFTKCIFCLKTTHYWDSSGEICLTC